MATFLIDGITQLPENGSTGWGTKLNTAINAIDGRFTWTGGQAVANKVAATGITGTTLPATLTASSLTSLGTLSGLTVSGTTTLSGLSTSASSFDLVNTTATTVNFAGAATALTIGATTGTTTVRNALTVTGNLTVNGTTTTVNSTTISVDDINLVLGDTASPSDTSANGGGITLKGTTDKTINWVQSTTAWTSSEDFNLLTGKVYEINGTTVLSATALGTGVTGSSLTSVGTIATGTWQGTAVAGQYGGTGVANTGKTITVSGNTTIGSSTHTVAFVTSGNTSLTLPTTGTLVNDAVTSLASLATVGTITSGTWNAAVIDGARGGTGVANTGKTITVSGNTTIGSSTNTVAFATSGNTSVTLPTTGTLATLAGSESLTNKKLGSLTTNGLVTTSGGDGTLSVTTMGTGVATFLSTPTSANLASAMTDETGSGALVFGTSPSFTTSIVTSSTTFSLINTNAATVDFAGAATALTIGATTGTTTVRNALTVTGATTLGPAVITTQSDTYVLALSDQGKVIEMTNSSAAQITVPPSGTTNFPIGTQIAVFRNGTGTVFFAPGAGVNIVSDSAKRYIATRYSAATLVKRAADEWYLIGNLSPS
jgi:hypothetical protein